MITPLSWATCRWPASEASVEKRRVQQLNARPKPKPTHPQKPTNDYRPAELSSHGHRLPELRVTRSNYLLTYTALFLQVTVKCKTTTNAIDIELLPRHKHIWSLAGTRLHASLHCAVSQAPGSLTMLTFPPSIQLSNC